MTTPRYCFGAEGGGDFFRRVADAEERCLDPFFGGSGWEYSRDYFESVPALKQNHRVTNLGFGAVEVFAVFIGTCFAKKIFDEVYDRSLKRPVSKFLDALFSKSGPSQQKPIEFRDVIYFEDIHTAVVVRIVVDRDSTKRIQALLSEAHRAAYTFIQNNGVKAPVHVHKIENGRVAIQPELFESLEQMKQKERRNS